MLLLRHWQHLIQLALTDFFILLAEADTPESWGECPIPVAEKNRR